eukprot:TRINITY_DN11110_c2_g1_i2.p1 TRINITY_DN11110_c2_g1~~TRINITY_DN11110_c2_g1_i2.p1  ORF type:complete len:100 (-),score=15.25 TRINITY_DN11110_c2_g1_i2:246-545(-)
MAMWTSLVVEAFMHALSTAGGDCGLQQSQCMAIPELFHLLSVHACSRCAMDDWGLFPECSAAIALGPAFSRFISKLERRRDGTTHSQGELIDLDCFAHC